MESIFEIALVNDIYIILVDQDIGRSVTNDARNVVHCLQDRIPGGIGKRTVVYRDTTGRFDKILVDAGAFAGFAPCTDSQQKYFTGLIS
jgi:hypothetical protein